MSPPSRQSDNHLRKPKSRSRAAPFFSFSFLSFLYIFFFLSDVVHEESEIAVANQYAGKTTTDDLPGTVVRLACFCS